MGVSSSVSSSGSTVANPDELTVIVSGAAPDCHSNGLNGDNELKELKVEDEQYSYDEEYVSEVSSDFENVPDPREDMRLEHIRQTDSI